MKEEHHVPCLPDCSIYQENTESIETRHQQFSGTSSCVFWGLVCLLALSSEDQPIRQQAASFLIASGPLYAVWGWFGQNFPSSFNFSWIPTEIVWDLSMRWSSYQFVAKVFSSSVWAGLELWTEWLISRLMGLPAVAPGAIVSKVSAVYLCLALSFLCQRLLTAAHRRQAASEGSLCLSQEGRETDKSSSLSLLLWINIHLTVLPHDSHFRASTRNSWELSIDTYTNTHNCVHSHS